MEAGEFVVTRDVDPGNMACGFTVSKEVDGKKHCCAVGINPTEVLGASSQAALRALIDERIEGAKWAITKGIMQAKLGGNNG